MNHFYELEVHPRILAAVRKARLKDFTQILSLSAGDLVRLTRLSISDVSILQKAVARTIPHVPVTTALDLWTKNPSCPPQLSRERLSTGCRVLDAFLRGTAVVVLHPSGGLLSQAVTEISGESASGKTQLCLQLCLTVQRPLNEGGLGSGAVYICTEDAFPSRRLKQMVDCFQLRCHQSLSSTLMDNIFIEHASDLDDLWHCLLHKVPLLLKSGRVRLIVVDSLAAVFRPEHVDVDLVKRAKQLSSFGGRLLQLSNEYNAVVVVVNQVSDVIGSDTSSASDRKTPALGIAWSNLVTVRLMLHRTNESITVTHNDSCDRPRPEETETDGRTCEATVRLLESVFAPHLPNSFCRYIIREDGVRGLG